MRTRGKAPPRPKRPGARRADAPIADVRDRFARSGASRAEDERRTQAFIAGKIEMIRRDPNMTAAAKVAAIRELERRRRR